MFDVSVLIVCYKSRALILGCLEGLFKHTFGMEYEVLMTDNSSDGTEQLVKDRYPKVQIIHSDRNIGFGAGNNLLARYATGKYLLLLNPDIQITSNAIGDLLAYAKKNNGAGIWGGITETQNGQVDEGCLQVGITLKKAFLYALCSRRFLENRSIIKDQFEGEVPVTTGAFMMIDRDVWNRVEGFDESFHLYAEEVDLCTRVRQVGKKVMMTGDSRVVHISGHGNPLSPERSLNMIRGDIHYILKHYGWCKRNAMRLLYLVGAVNRWLGSFVFSRKIGREKSAALRAAFGPIWRRPGNWWSGWSGRTGKLDSFTSINI